MTKAALIKDLKNMIGPAGKGSEVDDTGLTYWINEAYMLVVGKLIDKNPDHFTKQVSTSSIAGQGEYALPDDFEKMILASVSYDGTSYVRAQALNNIGQATTVANNNLAGDFSQASPFYYLTGNEIGFLPVFDTTLSNNIKIWTSYTPGEMVDDSDTPDLPARLQYALKYWAYANYLDQNDEHSAAERMRQRFDVTTEMVIDQMAERVVDEPRTVQVLDNTDLYSNYFLY